MPPRLIVHRRSKDQHNPASQNSPEPLLSRANTGVDHQKSVVYTGEVQRGQARFGRSHSRDRSASSKVEKELVFNVWKIGQDFNVAILAQHFARCCPWLPRKRVSGH